MRSSSLSIFLRPSSLPPVPVRRAWRRCSRSSRRRRRGRRAERTQDSAWPDPSAHLHQARLGVILRPIVGRGQPDLDQDVGQRPPFAPRVDLDRPDQTAPIGDPASGRRRGSDASRAAWWHRSCLSAASFGWQSRACFLGASRHRRQARGKVCQSRQSFFRGVDAGDAIDQTDATHRAAFARPLGEARNQ